MKSVQRLLIVLCSSIFLSFQGFCQIGRPFVSDTAKEVKRIIDLSLDIYNGVYYDEGEIKNRNIKLLKIVELYLDSLETLAFSISKEINPCNGVPKFPQKVYKYKGEYIFIYIDDYSRIPVIPGELVSEKEIQKIIRSFEQTFSTGTKRYHVHKVNYKGSTTEYKTSWDIDPAYTIYDYAEIRNRIQQNMKPLNLDSIPEIFR